LPHPAEHNGEIPSIAFGWPPLTVTGKPHALGASRAAPTFCATRGLIELIGCRSRPGAFQRARWTAHGLLCFEPVGEHVKNQYRMSRRAGGRAKRAAGIWPKGVSSGPTLPEIGLGAKVMVAGYF
jgi:hypothetical protein